MAEGFALTYRGYSQAYVAAQDEARAAACGKWATFRGALGVAAPTMTGSYALRP